MSTNFVNNSIDDLLAGVLTYGPDILKNCVVEPSDIVTQYLDRCEEEKLNYPKLQTAQPTSVTWLLPDEYLTLDIEEYLLAKCVRDEEKYRVQREIQLYNTNNMIPVLKTMKYVVDTLRANNVVWGVGRGSSVASYCLFLLGVHKIDSIKYKLSIGEFFKGEENG